MTNHQIFSKIRPFVLKRVCYAILGFVVILILLFLIAYWGNRLPEYRTEIIILCAGIAIFAGWKIIRLGESQYRMAQVYIITQLITGKEYVKGDQKRAVQEVRRVFKYSRVTSLAKNIVRHKNFKKVGQYLLVMTANMIPYMGLCTLSWVFAHPEGERKREGCRGVSVYLQNRRELRPVLLKAFVREFFIVVVVFVFALIAGAIFQSAVVFEINNLNELFDAFDGFTDVVDEVWDVYIEQRRGYTNAVVVIAAYFAWFVKTFGIRAYQIIGIIRAYLAAGEKNPPNDDLYERLKQEKEKADKKIAEQKMKTEAANKAPTDQSQTENQSDLPTTESKTDQPETESRNDESPESDKSDE